MESGKTAEQLREELTRLGESIETSASVEDLQVKALLETNKLPCLHQLL